MGLCRDCIRVVGSLIVVLLSVLRLSERIVVLSSMNEHRVSAKGRLLHACVGPHYHRDIGVLRQVVFVGSDEGVVVPVADPGVGRQRKAAALVRVAAAEDRVVLH